MTEAEANLLRALRDDAIPAVELLRDFGGYGRRAIYAAQVAELLQLRIDQVSARLRGLTERETNED